VCRPPETTSFPPPNSPRASPAAGGNDSTSAHTHGSASPSADRPLFHYPGCLGRFTLDQDLKKLRFTFELARLCQRHKCQLLINCASLLNWHFYSEKPFPHLFLIT